MTAPGHIHIRIDRLILESDHPVEAVAMRRALSAALHAVVVERGVPDAWNTGRADAVAVTERPATASGDGDEHGLARAAASQIYDRVLP